ncbi:1-acylglycerol-3-phosphate O [Mycena metata]|uniref:1-acylglycerol-3-phosphate O n=1 Tax=Mycena metata TaxID=1033252 RepID=A0AAD7J5B1_9AGAR|nr:1-acylglycerol-3-phosphate O [Mycena metata]
MATLLSTAFVVPLIALQTLPVGRYYTRSVVYVGAMGFVASIGAFFAAGLSIVNRRFDVNHAVARTFYAFAGTLIGWRVEVEGEEWLRDSQDGGGRPAVFMINHQSMVDLIPLGLTMPKRTSIMSKESIRWSPLGPFMMMSGAIFIDRGNSARALRSLDAAGEMMRSQRVSLWMYPEGTRNNQPRPGLLPFKKGGFHLAVQAGLPIVPIVVENYWHLYHKNVFDSGVIRVRVLPPIPTTDLTAADVPDLVTRVRDQMLATLIEISTKASPSAPVPEKPIAPPNPASMSSVAAVMSDVVSDHSTVMPADAVFEAHAAVPAGGAGSENGTETEEDEGMVLVDRPT